MNPIEPTTPSGWTLRDLTPEQVFQLGEAWGMVRASFESADEAADRLRVTLDRTTAERLKAMADQAGLRAELKTMQDEARTFAILTRAPLLIAP